MVCEHHHFPPCPYCEIRRLRRALLERELTGQVVDALVAVQGRAQRAELAVLALTAERDQLHADLLAAEVRMIRLTTEAARDRRPA